MAFGKKENTMKPFKAGVSLLVFSIMIFSILTFPSILYKLGNGSALYFLLLAAILFVCLVLHICLFLLLQTYKQKETPDEYMARVFSIVAMISRGGASFGGLIYGIILNKAEVHLILLITSLLMLLITIVLLRPLEKIMN